MAKDALRETDDAAIRLAKTLLRSARHGALAVLQPGDGAPMASRVGVATDFDGTPVILVSTLAEHTRAILADPRCSLLLGEPGKGDALAHPRIGIACRAVQLAAGDSRREHVRRRYLNRNPKAKLYAELGDFHFFRLEMLGANLNGGFARAYRLTADQLRSPVPDGLADLEQSALDHMNGDHADAVHLYAEVLARLGGKGWKLCGIDADGLDLVSADATGRVFYPGVLESTDALRPMLALMAREARAARD